MYNHPQVAITEEEFDRRQQTHQTRQELLELLRSLQGSAQGTAQVPADTLDANIAQLKVMGYIESEAREALQATGGIVENAIDWLLEKAEAGDTTTAIAAADKFAAEAEAEDTAAAIAAAEKFAAEEEAAFKAQLEAMVQSDTGYGTGYGPGDKSPTVWTWSGPTRMTSEEMRHLSKAPAPEPAPAPAPDPAPEATSVAPTPVTPEQAEIIEYIKTQKILQDYVSSTGEKINTFRGFLHMAKLYDYKDLPLMDTLTLQGVVDDSDHIDTAFVTSLGILKEFHHKRFLRQLIILTEDDSPEVGLRIKDTSRMLGHLTLAEKLLIVEHIKNNETIQVKDEPPLIMQLLPGDVIEAALDKAELKETFEGKLLIAQLLNIKARRQTHFHDSETIFREAIDLLNSIGDMADIQVTKNADILWRLQGNLAMSQIAQKKYEDADATLRDMSMTCAGASNIPNCEQRKTDCNTKKGQDKLAADRSAHVAKYGHIAEGKNLEQMTSEINEKERVSNKIGFIEFLLNYLPDTLKTESDKLLEKLIGNNNYKKFYKLVALLLHPDKFEHSQDDKKKGEFILKKIQEVVNDVERVGDIDEGGKDNEEIIAIQKGVTEGLEQVEIVLPIDESIGPEFARDIITQILKTNHLNDLLDEVQHDRSYLKSSRDMIELCIKALRGLYLPENVIASCRANLVTYFLDKTGQAYEQYYWPASRGGGAAHGHSLHSYSKPKEKTQKRRTQKRKTQKRKSTKRKTKKRKTNKRKTQKRKTKKSKRR